MSPEDIKKILIFVCSFLVIFVLFFFLFWRPRYSDLKVYQKDLSEKQAELAQLERDAKNWPDSITRGKLRQYEEELARVWELIPTKEKVADLLKEIQAHARESDLEIIAMNRVTDSRGSRTAGKADPRYVKVPYKISVGGNYFGLINFMRMLEDSSRLVTITSTKVYSEEGIHLMGAEIQFNVFYSKVGVGTG